MGWSTCRLFTLTSMKTIVKTWGEVRVILRTTLSLIAVCWKVHSKKGAKANDVFMFQDVAPSVKYVVSDLMSMMSMANPYLGS